MELKHLHYKWLQNRGKTFNRTAYGIETTDSDQMGDCWKSFNRTAYGIETKLQLLNQVTPSGLLIAPLMELKLVSYYCKFVAHFAFNRTAYGIETAEKRIVLLQIVNF